MQKKKENPSVHDLRDRPVPPVKGAVTDWTDVVLRPEGMMAPGLVTGTEEIRAMDREL